MKNSKTIVTAILAVMILATPLLAQETDSTSARMDGPEDFTKTLTEVKSKIELTKDQEKEISQVFREYRKGRKGVTARFGNEKRKDRDALRMEMRELNRKTHQRVEDILGPDKAEAFREIARRHRGGPMDGKRGRRADNRETRRDRNHEDAEARFADMTERLGLDNEQAEKVREILDDQREKMRSMRDDGNRKDMDKMRGRMDEMNLETEKRLSGVLTQEQMETYRKIASERREMMRGARDRRRR